MKSLNAFVLIAAASLAGAADTHSQEAPSTAPAPSNDRKAVGSTDPSAASSLSQREATSIKVPETTIESNAEASSASSRHQRDSVSFTRGSDGSATGLNDKWVSAIVGMKVETPSGRRLGTVKNVIVDGYGRASHAIVAHGGVMGLGTRYTAVPWESVAEMLESDRLLVDAAMLENGPTLSAATPQPGDESWRAKSNNYWRGKVALGRQSTREQAAR